MNIHYIHGVCFATTNFKGIYRENILIRAFMMMMMMIIITTTTIIIILLDNK